MEDVPGSVVSRLDLRRSRFFLDCSWVVGIVLDEVEPVRAGVEGDEEVGTEVGSLDPLCVVLAESGTEAAVSLARSATCKSAQIHH